MNTNIYIYIPSVKELHCVDDKDKPFSFKISV